MKLLTKKNIVVVSLLAIALLCLGTFVWRDQAITAREVETVMQLGRMRHAFWDFRKQHGRWPDSFDEASINKYTQIDPLSQRPFCVVTQKNLYYKGVERPLDQILVMQPEPYRNRPWPFGEQSLIVLTDYHDVRYVTPSQIITKAGKQGAARP